MNKNFSSFFILAILGFSSVSSAATYLRIAGYYNSATTGTETSSSTSGRTLLDFGLDFASQDGWAAGVLYASQKYSPSSGADRTALGVTGGWIAPRDTGPYLLASYFLQVNRSDNLTGSGCYQIDFGYRLSLGSVGFGPQISYKQFAYDKQNSNSISPKILDNGIDPYFSLWFNF